MHQLKILTLTYKLFQNIFQVQVRVMVKALLNVKKIRQIIFNLNIKNIKMCVLNMMVANCTLKPTKMTTFLHQIPKMIKTSNPNTISKTKTKDKNYKI